MWDKDDELVTYSTKPNMLTRFFLDETRRGSEWLCRSVLNTRKIHEYSKKNPINDKINPIEL